MGFVPDFFLKCTKVLYKVWTVFIYGSSVGRVKEKDSLLDLKKKKDKFHYVRNPSKQKWVYRMSRTVAVGSNKFIVKE